MTATRRDGGKPSVLVVDDEDRLRTLVAGALRQAAFQVAEACDAAEALRVLGADGARVDGLFTDVHMPGDMTGVALAHEARRFWPRIALLITSGHLLSAADVLPEGSRFLPKPYRAEDVVRCLRDIGVE